MTREQKVEWLSEASNDDIINQMYHTVIRMSWTDSLKEQIEAQEDYDLAVKELKKRLK